MKRRWLLGLGTIALALAAGELWWKLTTPPNDGLFPFPVYEDTLPSFYYGVLYREPWPSRIGYTPTQRLTDKIRGERYGAAIKIFENDLEAKRRSGMSVPQLIAYRDRHQEEAWAKADRAVGGPRSSLNRAQERTLRRLAVRAYGLWLMGDRRVARFVGIGEKQRRFIVEANDRLYKFHNREFVEADINRFRFQGAPLSTLRRWREAIRINTAPFEYWAESDAARERRQRRLDELQRDAGVKVWFDLPRWVADHWQDGVRRKVAAERARLESEIDRGLTREGRARWEAFVRGETPV